MSLLNDRVLTRIVQAFGRCTRSATDYAAVVILGEELNTYLLTRDGRSFLHPELQAELEFGIDQSKNISSQEFLDNLKLFFEQGNDWREADNSIVSLRQNLKQEELPGTLDLKDSVSHEIDYQYALWNGDFPTALGCCRKVISALNHSDLRGYRGLWYYLAGSAAKLCSKEKMGELDNIAKDYFSKAMSASPAIRWLVQLSKVQGISSNSNETDKEDSSLITIIERLENKLEELGTSNDRKYTKLEKNVLENLLVADSIKFENAQKELGSFLGFESGNHETQGAPDPWWIIDENSCIVFEDHSDADSNSSLSITKARQVASHPNWIKEHVVTLNKNAEIIAVLVTPVKVADKDALTHLGSVCLWNIDDFREWGKKALSLIRELRHTFPGSGDITWRTMAMEQYIASQIDPQSLIKMLKSNLASERLKPTK